MQMYLDALFDFYREKSEQRELRVDEIATLESHGLSLDKLKSHEEIEEVEYGRKSNLSDF